MCSAAAGAFIDLIATDPSVRRTVEAAIQEATERATLAALAALGRQAGYHFTVDELTAGPEGITPTEPCPEMQRPPCHGVVLSMVGRAA